MAYTEELLLHEIAELAHTIGRRYLEIEPDHQKPGSTISVAAHRSLVAYHARLGALLAELAATRPDYPFEESRPRGL